MADFPHEFTNSPIVPVMPFSGFLLCTAPKWGHETEPEANTRLFIGFWDCTFGDDVFHISSVSLAFKFSHFDTFRLSDSC